MLEKFHLYVVELRKVIEKPFNDEIIALHVEYLKHLKSKNFLVLCGPFLDKHEGIVILRVASKQEAIDIAFEDPFVKNGYSTFDVFTLLEACEANNFLT